MSIPLTGFHAIEEILRRGRTKGTLYLSREKKKNDQLRVLAEEAGVPIALVDDQELDRMGGKGDHRGALLLLEEMPLAYKDNLGFVLAAIQTSNALGIVLDGITDPHNFGAIIRTADQFCADFIITTSRRSVGETQTVIKTSSGASSYATIITIPNLSTAIAELKKHEFWIYGAEMDAPTAASVDLKGRVALVLGSEGKGLHRLVRESCDGVVSIPAKGHVDSFNVSVAAGILMYEVRRQQGF
jgi:23S rRNA (guanosine2251-2'-O)-methyltransferase